MRILVTGGAGYIGSACTKALLDKGHSVVVLDNLSKGIKSLIDSRAEFLELDLCQDIDTAFDRIDAVIHIASYKAAGESMHDPSKYSDNIKGTINLLDAMVKHQVSRIIFSGSAAVYGMPKYTPVDEGHPCSPINYYGYTKLCNEDLIRWYAQIHGLQYVSLRYFNVAGDFGLGYLDPEPQNVMPILMEAAAGKRQGFEIFGTDYDTRDGTCVRDYIDVRDLVRAHVAALELKQNAVINLGTEKGTTVRELIDAVKKASGSDFAVSEGPRREGDPATLVASCKKAREQLGWNPEHDINSMVGSTWKVYQSSL